MLDFVFIFECCAFGFAFFLHHGLLLTWGEQNVKESNLTTAKKSEREFDDVARTGNLTSSGVCWLSEASLLGILPQQATCVVNGRETRRVPLLRTYT